jgi:lycopene cyclase domain-containing protein
MVYALVLIFIVVASIWLELALRTSVFRRWRRLLATVGIACTPFLLWDLLAATWGHWSFDASKATSLQILGGFPVEEFLFFPIVGLAAILTLEGVRAVRMPVSDDEQS